ncbi:MAG TPA: hypothetical protein PKU93_02370 [Candidatus Pacearchaeota archaeon]|nr:hypothetical protein [Candidatus Pacearchaeota archaeon]
MIYEVTTSTSTAFAQAWASIVNFLPMFLAALVVFIIGWILSIGIGRLVSEILRKFGFNNIFRRTGWENAFKRADIEVDPSQFVGVITKWIFVIIFLMISSDILHWSSFSVLLGKIIWWIPNLIVAIIILVVAIVLADILEKIVKATVDRMGVASANFLGSLTKWVIYVVASLAILSQLNVAPTIVDSIVIGIVATFVLAFGLAFGLGGREEAGRVLKMIREKVESSGEGNSKRKK